MKFDLARLLGVIYPIIVIGLIVLFLVSFYLFVNRMITSRRHTVASLRSIEQKLDLIVNELNAERVQAVKHNELKGADKL